jgi:uncharacterized membrane protein YqjE
MKWKHLTLINAIVALTGVVLVVYGVWSIYRPAAFIAGGLMLVLATISHERSASR